MRAAALAALDPSGELDPAIEPGVAAIMQRATSSGYIRNRLTVLNGGGVVRPAIAAVDGAALAASALADNSGLALRWERIHAARIKGYEGDSCAECGNFTLVRNGTCLKCDTCGATSGCS